MPRHAWWWAALALGAGLRVFLVVATPGTDDVPIWQSHAGWTWQYGLVGYYGRSDVFNHPPFIARVMESLWTLARATDLPFRVLLRAPFALLDLGNLLLLLALFRDSRQRLLIGACYWLHPLAILMSAYHGNTDTAVAFFMLLTILAATRAGPAAAGAALGVGLWIKLPVLLAGPAVFFALRGHRERARFAAAVLAVGALGYLPELVTAPGLLWERVFSYGGRSMATPGGTPIWGVWSLLGQAPPPPLERLSAAHLAHNTIVCWLPILLLAWLRRAQRSAVELGITVCASILVLFGFTHNLWAFQYVAWIVPFLFFPGPRFAALASLLLGGYVYGVYAFLAGGPLLLGKWDFRGTRDWPAPLVGLRSASVLLCFVSAWVFLGAAALREWRRQRAGR